MKLTFLGTGTSTGIPMIGCGCDVCRSGDPRNKRRRASALISQGASRWLIDAGPDFRSQALDAGLESLDGVLLTHAHADHILGLDDLRPLSWKKTTPVWADEPTLRTVHTMFPYFSTEGGKSSRPRLEFHRLSPGVPVEVSGLPVLPLALQHGDDAILGFRIGGLAYLTDCNAIPAASLALLGGLDILVLDALRPKPHPTHFNIEEAVRAARAVNAKQTYFIHMSHDVEHAAWAASLPAGMQPAYDGLTLEF